MSVNEKSSAELRFGGNLSLRRWQLPAANHVNCDLWRKEDDRPVVDWILEHTRLTIGNQGSSEEIDQGGTTNLGQSRWGRNQHRLL